MGNQLPPGPGNNTVQGSIEGVPCPHCGKKNDLRDMQAQQLLDTGHRMSCDHCQRIMEVTSIRQLTVVAVRRYQGQQGGLVRQQPHPQQRPQQGGVLAAAKRLLGGPKR